MIFWLLMICGGLCWSLVYLLIIRRGFLDATYGMPLAALCANLSWEFWFAFIFTQGPIQTKVNTVWFLLDLAILVQAIVFGPREFPRLSRGLFYVAFSTGLLTALLTVYSVTIEFKDYDGVYTAFGQNLMMSLLFLWMLYARNSLRGQSPTIAILKMVGTACNSAAFWLYTSVTDGSVLLPFLFLAILFFDAIYAVLVWRASRGVLPWKAS